MSANDAFAADGAKLLAVFGETVIRWPLGNEGEAEEVTAIVDFNDETQSGQLAGGRAVRDEDGEQIVRTCMLEVAAGQATDDRDRWVVNGQRWQAVREVARDTGLKTVLIERVEKIRTSKRSNRAR